MISTVGENKVNRQTGVTQEDPLHTSLPSQSSRHTHQNIAADVLQLLLDLFPVLFGHLLLLVTALGLLLDAGDDAPGGTPGAHHVLVGHRQQVAVLVGEGLAQLGHLEDEHTFEGRER